MGHSEVSILPLDKAPSFNSSASTRSYSKYPRASSFTKDTIIRDSKFSVFASIRVVLVLITILTVLALGVGLIVLVIQGQQNIVDDLSTRIQEGVSVQIKDSLDGLFQYVEDEMLGGRSNFLITPNLTAKPWGVNPFTDPDWKVIGEYLWSVVKKRPVGMEAEFDFIDGGYFATQSYNYYTYTLWGDIVHEPDDVYLSEVAFPLDLDKPIASVDFSNESNILFTALTPGASGYERPDLTSCSMTPEWEPSIYPLKEDGNLLLLLYTHINVCNSNEIYIGNMWASIALSSVLELLEYLTSEVVDGKIFIMDAEYQLVGASTNSTEICTFDEDGWFKHVNIFNTTEQWIRDVVSQMDGDYGVQRKTVTINGTIYYLSVGKYQQFTGIDWSIVELLEQEQFLGNSREYFKKSVITAALVTVAAIAIVMFVSWKMTNPLFILSMDLQKMALLDFEVSDMSTPRLLEVRRLYRSVANMYVALQSFKKFVPVQVIMKVLKSGKAISAELTPAKVTIVFQDIEGFTTLSEKMNPIALARLTSEYMEIMTEIISRHGGTIDKYIGDCIMSLFNAPDDLPRHQLAATKAAVECIKTLAVKNIEWKQQYGCAINCRIGINTGEVLVGNMGGDYRMNYTVFGDNVNVAARLEGVNKHFGTRIMISKSVYENFKKEGGNFAIRKVAKVRVSGKSLPTSIYEVRADNTMVTMQMFSLYKQALQSFKKRDFGAASTLINEAISMDSHDKACKQLRDRIEEVLQQGVSPDWTYIEDLSKL